VAKVITRPGGLKTSYATGQDNGFWVFYNGISREISRAEESTRETEEKLDGRSKEGHEREEPARRAVGR
jgi:hypothetical protein